MLKVIALSFFLQAHPFDILIQHARIVDGSGNPWYLGSIGIRGDTIAAIGNLDGAPAKLVIDAKGLTVAPGFIDIHTHARRGIFEDTAAQNYIRQGVTTLIEGPDGSSPLPIAPFLAKIAETKIAPNFGLFVGLGSIRQQVLGLENRKATAEEIAKMKEIARQAMLDGALGLSTGLFYVPGNFTPTEEVVEIAKVVGAFGGIHISHMRDEAEGVMDSVRETIRIGEEGGLPTQVTHHKIIGAGNWGKSIDTLRLVEEARARGVDVTIDAYPYTASSTGTGALFPQWSLAGGQKAFLERLSAPEQRVKITAEIIRRIKVDRGGGDPKNVVMANCSFDPSLAGKSLAEITALRGRAATIENAAETAMEIQQKGGCSAVFHAISEEDVERILRSPYTMIGSDGEIPQFGRGAPHTRSYGTFARVLARYVRQRKTLTLEDAVRKMSGYPAERLRLLDRGLLRPGMKADIVIFDPAKIQDKADYANPHQYAEGVREVIVNGELVISGGQLTNARPGRVINGRKDR
ncbi:MAG TPA: D-aminoacylase [Bryobacteraceae bacterium]|nr:D-aminoacylase [Bryobacteraceae bacterium]